jgi:hypothetical protein
MSNDRNRLFRILEELMEKNTFLAYGFLAALLGSDASSRC